jgi:hypothetical protein
MSDRAHDVFLKLIAVLIAVGAVVHLATNVAAGGLLRGVWTVFVTFVLLATARGFARYRGWAFLLVSVLLLAGWLSAFVRMVVAFDRGGFAEGRPHLLCLLGIIVLIGYLGRWGMERRFRPHLEAGH